MRLLYYTPYSRGGMAEYSHHQAIALARLGLAVTVLCPAHDEGPWHRVDADARPYDWRPVLQGWRVRALPGLARRVLFARDIVLDARILADVARHEHFPRVLIAAYNEYFAPVWAGWLRRLTREQGTVFGAVVHDPTRTGGVGPGWWRRWSIEANFRVLREAFVHAPVALDTIHPMPALRTTVIPQGLYQAPPSLGTRADWRARHGLPPDAQVLLSFGYIRDDKNLDLTLRALVCFPELFLVVAGTEQSSAQKNADFYRTLAAKLGVADRCRWLIGFIPNEDIGDIFTACDLLMLTYSGSFASASAVLNMAINFCIPCLASGGEGNLRVVVRQYGLGMWIEPDNLEALVAGIECWRRGEMPVAHWDDFARDNSWRRNAQIVAEKMDLLDPA